MLSLISPYIFNNLTWSIGQPDKAAVWWIMDPTADTDIVGWEIHRYRRDLNGTDWSLKGYLSMKALGRKQVMIENLTNGYEYRFTVKSINSLGPSAESQPSNTVVIESILPIGWFRFYDKKMDKFYYANLKTKQSTWSRPDLDPDFLDEEIVFNFNKHEIVGLRELFVEVNPSNLMSYCYLTLSLSCFYPIVTLGDASF